MVCVSASAALDRAGDNHDDAPDGADAADLPGMASQGNRAADSRARDNLATATRLRGNATRRLAVDARWNPRSPRRVGLGADPSGDRAAATDAGPPANRCCAAYCRGRVCAW